MLVAQMDKDIVIVQKVIIVLEEPRQRRQQTKQQELDAQQGTTVPQDPRGPLHVLLVHTNRTLEKLKTRIAWLVRPKSFVLALV